MKTFEEYKFTIQHTAIVANKNNNFKTLQDFANAISVYGDTKRIICEYDNSYYYLSINIFNIHDICILGPGKSTSLSLYKTAGDGWSYEEIMSKNRQELNRTLKYAFEEKDIILTDISEYDGLVLLKFEDIE